MKRMPKKGEKWSRDEMILVFNLYFKLPYGKMDHRTTEVKELAAIMGRTDNSIAMRLNNFASCDPMLQQRGIKSLGDHKKQCQPYWDEFFANREALVFESERILAEYQNMTLEEKYKKEIIDIPKDVAGTVRISEVKVRVNQSFFRKIVMANYNNKCALTGIDIPELLIASHIIPWAKNEKERLNPANGICLSALYDKAFDCGLITFSNDGIVQLSSHIKKNIGKNYYDKYFEIIKDRKLVSPTKYSLNPLFLEWHRDNIFDKIV